MGLSGRVLKGCGRLIAAPCCDIDDELTLWLPFDILLFCSLLRSTSLAKTAHYFLSKSLTVGVGACDTFRAGAIEQLRTHTKALNIPLYARGYDRDAASVAQDAIAQARRDGLNVVLIDTAGRMQHNEPLMRALAKLITLNKPDLVLFVGEALVGNDAVDQVQEFNRCLSDLSDEKKPRLIDGIILTKFDTIDDRCGAAISMAYVTGQPILFVGTGQTYADLKRMNVKTLVRALMK
jgi:signal recognition particle receptor subunit alpha